MSKYKKWNNDELEFIKLNCHLLSDEELSKQLTQICEQDITTSMIRRQRRKLKIEKKKGRRPKRTSEISLNIE